MLYQAPAHGGPKTPKRGVVRDTWPIFHIDARNHIFGTAEARVAKFYIRIEYIKCYPWDNKMPHNGRGQGHATLS